MEDPNDLYSEGAIPDSSIESTNTHVSAHAQKVLAHVDEDQNDVHEALSRLQREEDNQEVERLGTDFGA